MGTRRIGLGYPNVNGIVYLQADEISTNPASNTSVVRCYLESADGNGASNVYGGVTDATGNRQMFGGVSGGGAWTQGPWDITCVHNADGSLTVGLYLQAAGGPTGTATAAGSLTLTTLARAPGTPTSPILTRNSDSQNTASWTRQDPNNAAATGTYVQQSINGGAYSQAFNGGAVSSVALATVANRKTVFQVRMSNAAGTSAFSAVSNAVWTTPAAPSNVQASRSGLDIALSWLDNTAYAERQFIVQHGTVTGGVTTWDSGNLATVAGSSAAGGTFSYTHVSPAQGVTHVYRVAAQTTDTAHLTSTYVLSNTAIPPTPPNLPTWVTLPTFAAASQPLTVNWNHNAVDSSPQSYFSLRYSTNGGSSWTTIAKTASTTSSYTLPTFPTGTVLTIQVMTWGIATTGGSDGTGGSPWSNIGTVTFRTSPTVTITTPANNSTVIKSSTSVVLGFSQPEGANFVQATIQLSQAGTILEQVSTVTLTGTPLSTHLDTGLTYQLDVTAIDSNGLTAAASGTFTALYAQPVTPIVEAQYLPDSGVTQLIVTVPTPGPGDIAAATMTVTRAITGQLTDVLVDRMAVTPGGISILDLTPTIHGDNVYTVVFTGEDATASTATLTVTTAEDTWCFMNTGAGWTDTIAFYGNVEGNLASTPLRDSALVVIDGRARPIVLFGNTATLDVIGTATIDCTEGSTPEQVEQFCLTADRVCYRDWTGRRVFGLLVGKLSNRNWYTATFDYTVSEAT